MCVKERQSRDFRMAQNFDDLNLPNTVVTRIAKEALPDNVAIGKEARTALAKAASVFVLYITSASNAIANKSNRRTIGGNDVLLAMEEIDFGMFVEPLQEALEHFRKFQQDKKDAVVKRKQDKDERRPTESEDAGGDEDVNSDPEDCV